MITTAVDLVLRVSLLFGAAALLSLALRRSSAAARHLVWTFAIAGSLVLPIVSFLALRWELPILPASVAGGLAVREATDAARVASAPARGTLAVAPAARPAARHERPGGTAAARGSTHAQQGASTIAFFTPPRVMTALWMGGFLLVLLRLALGTARMWWIARRATPISTGQWLRLAERLATALGVRRRVVFLEGSPSAMPMTWGVLRPRVLLPGTAGEWPIARQRVVLLHELAHVKRRDCMTQLLAQAACALYWFHPLAWLAARRLRAERERACDDLVIAAGTRGSEYADHLLEIARSMRSVALPTWAAVAMAHRSQLEGRLMAILDPEVPRRLPTRRRSLALAAAVAALIVPISLITPVPEAAETVVFSGPQDGAEPLPSPAPAATPAAPVSAPVPAAAPSKRSRQDARTLATIVKDATEEAIPEALADLRKEQPWLAPIVEGALQGAGEGIALAVGQAVDGVPGGVRGGVGKRIVGEPVAQRDPRAVAALVEALKDSDKEVRESAMHALANMRAPEAIEAIRGALKDQDASVREQAAFALGQYRDRASVDALAQALKDENASVREQAAFALGQLRSVPSIDALAAALKDASASVREQAAFALGQIRDRRAVDSLLAALRDENADVREQAAFALGQLGDARAIEGLTAALKDANVEVRRQAAFALGQVAK